MMTKIENFADNLKAESRVMADRAVAGLRTAGLETAGFITKSKRPVKAVEKASLKLNALTHKSIESLLKQQFTMVEDLIDESAKRIEMAAKAKSVKTLVEGQVAALPKSRDQAVANAKKTVAIVRDTGDAFGDLFKDTVVDISSARPARKKATRKKAPAKKTAAKKRAARKAPARKAAAKKTVAKKAPAKPAEATPAQAA